MSKKPETKAPMPSIVRNKEWDKLLGEHFSQIGIDEFLGKLGTFYTLPQVREALKSFDKMEVINSDMLLEQCLRNRKTALAIRKNKKKQAPKENRSIADLLRPSFDHKSVDYFIRMNQTSKYPYELVQKALLALQESESLDYSVDNLYSICRQLSTVQKGAAVIPKKLPLKSEKPCKTQAAARKFNVELCLTVEDTGSPLVTPSFIVSELEAGISMHKYKTFKMCGQVDTIVEEEPEMYLFIDISGNYIFRSIVDRNVHTAALTPVSARRLIDAGIPLKN